MKIRLELNKGTVILMMVMMLVMGCIYYFSAQPVTSSEKLSMGVVNTIIHNLNHIFDGNPPQFIINRLFQTDHFVRKSAHFVVYFLLGAVSYGFTKRIALKHPLVKAIFFCFVFAASDELHQRFVPGRGPMWQDVMLDSIAAFVAMVLMVVVTRAWHARVWVQKMESR